MSQADLHGLPLTCSSSQAADAFNATILGYLKYRADLPVRLKATLEADGDFPMAHALKGYFAMLSFKQANVAGAREALAAASKLAPAATAREQAHVAALSHWIAGDLDRTLETWEQILDAHPRDVLAFRLHHFNAFWLGRPEAMAREVEAVMPAWAPELPGWGSLLACRCFAHEEMGNYALAEPAGREAIAIDKGDLWAAHAVAHVLEMQGRRDEGIAWLAELEPHWDGGNNLMHHLWWHRGLYHLERREFDEVLNLYDRRFRNLGSPLTASQPDLYIDVQNAASMLFRLERQGVDVGNRWNEIADRAEARVGDCLSPFTLPHWMMALAAARRFEAAGRMLEGMRTFASGDNPTLGPLVRDYALPISEAIVARAQGRHDEACARMRPAIDGMYRLGGSHAQQDVLEQLFLDCAVAARSERDVRMLLGRVRSRHPVDPERRVGYAEAARTLGA
jgi:tetratricopeptide (TPR) repeat protein